MIDIHSCDIITLFLVCENSNRLMYIAPSGGHSLLNFDLPFRLIIRGSRLFCYVWSEILHFSKD